MAGCVFAPGRPGGPWSVNLWDEAAGDWRHVASAPTRAEGMARLCSPGLTLPPPDPFAEAERANAPGATRHALASHARQREAGRDAQPLPEGGLFDEVRRNTQELF